MDSDGQVLDLAALLDREDLSTRDLQSFHHALDQEKGFDRDILRNVAYLTGEIGEMVQAIFALNKAEGAEMQRATRKAVGDELTDCLAYVVKIANYAGVDLQSAYASKMKHNLSRTWRKL